MAALLRTFCSLFFISVLFLSAPSWADIAGRVVMANGQVTAVDASGNSRVLQRRSTINEQDTIITDTNSKVQIRFIDQGLITLNEKSQLNIQAYQQSKNEGDSGQVLLELVEGGFRSLTGTIGKGTPEAYKVITPAASIGIRGTLYSIQLQDDLLLAAVWQGGIRVSIKSGKSYDLGLDAAFRFGIFGRDGFTGLINVPAELEKFDQDSAPSEQPESQEQQEQSEHQGESNSNSENNSATDHSNNETSNSAEDSLPQNQQAVNTSPVEQMDEERLTDFIDNLDPIETTPTPDPIPEIDLGDLSLYSPYFAQLTQSEVELFAEEVRKEKAQGQQTRALIGDQFYEGYIFDDADGGRIFAFKDETNNYQALRFKMNNRPSWAVSNEGARYGNSGTWFNEVTEFDPNYLPGKIEGVSNTNREQPAQGSLHWVSLPTHNLATSGSYVFTEIGGSRGRTLDDIQGKKILNQFELNFATGEVKNGIFNLYYDRNSSPIDGPIDGLLFWQGAFAGRLENGELKLGFIDSNQNKLVWEDSNDITYIGEFDYQNSKIIGLVGADGAVTLVRLEGTLFQGDGGLNSDINVWANNRTEYGKTPISDFSNPPQINWAEIAPVHPYLTSEPAKNLELAIESGFKANFSFYNLDNNSLSYGSGFMFTKINGKSPFYLDSETSARHDGRLSLSGGYQPTFQLKVADPSPTNELEALKAPFDANQVGFGYWMGRGDITENQSIYGQLEGNSQIMYASEAKLYYTLAKGIELNNALGERVFELTLMQGNSSPYGNLTSSEGSFNLDLATGNLEGHFSQVFDVNTIGGTVTWNANFSGTLANGHFQSDIQQGNVEFELNGLPVYENIQSGHIVGTVFGQLNSPEGAITAHQLTSSYQDGNEIKNISTGGVLGWTVRP